MKTVQTVTGPVAPEDLGTVLLHEHVLISNQVALYELHGDPSVYELWDADISIEILGALRKSNSPDPAAKSATINSSLWSGRTWEDSAIKAARWGGV